MCVLQLQRLAVAAVTLGLSLTPGYSVTMAQAPPRVWRVDPAPVVAIGGASGTGPTEFTRIMGLMRLSTGAIAVADGGASDLRYFDAAGRFLKTATRNGEGPGEIRGVDAAFSTNDTIYVYDEYGLLSVFDGTGTYVRRARLREMTVGSGLFGGVPVGVLVGGRPVGYKYTGPDARSVRRHQSEVIVASADAATGTHSFGTYPSIRLFQKSEEKGPRSLGFSPMLASAVFPTQVCLGTTDQYDIKCLDEGNRIVRRITQTVVPIRVTRTMREAVVYDMSGRLPGGGSRYEGSLRAHREKEARTLEFADHLPLFARMVASRSGDLWVQDYRSEDGIRGYSTKAPPVPSRWRVFDDMGKLAGTIRLPSRFFLRDAGADWVLGVSFDEDDVESVTMLHIIR